MSQAFLLIVALCATPNLEKEDCELVHMRPVVAESLKTCITQAIYQLQYFRGTTVLPYKYTTCMILGEKQA